MDKYVSVGKILNFHGIQGEAKVGFSTNQTDFLKSLKSAFIKFEDEYKSFKILSVRFNKSFALIKFQGINSINELIPYKGCLIFVEKQTVRESLEENEFLIDELTGLEVFDEDGNNIGVAVGVSNNGINDFISVKSKSKNICLVPFVKALVPEVDIKKKKITIKNIKGLVE